MYGSSLNVTDPLLELLWLRLIWKLGRKMMLSDESGIHSIRNSPFTLLLPLLLLERLLRNEADWYCVVKVSDSDSLNEREVEPLYLILPPITSGNSLRRRG